MLIDRTGQKFSAKAKFAEKCQLVVYEIFHSKQLGFDTVLPNPRQDSKRNCISGRPTPGLGTLGTEGRSPKWDCVRVRDAGCPSRNDLGYAPNREKPVFVPAGELPKATRISYEMWKVSVSLKFRKFSQWIRTKNKVRFLLSEHFY